MKEIDAAKKENILKFLTEKLEPQKMKVQNLSISNTWGLTSEERFKLDSQYTLECDILRIMEREYQKMLSNMFNSNSPS